MPVANVTVYLPNGFFALKGYEYLLVLLVANIAFMLLGSGPASVDMLLFGLST